MKTLKLCNTAYIDLTEEQYKNLTTVRMLDKTTNEVVCEAKEINLHSGMVLLVPLDAFETP